MDPMYRPRPVGQWWCHPAPGPPASPAPRSLRRLRPSPRNLRARCDLSRGSPTEPPDRRAAAFVLFADLSAPPPSPFSSLDSPVTALHPRSAPRRIRSAYFLRSAGSLPQVVVVGLTGASNVPIARLLTLSLNLQAGCRRTVVEKAVHVDLQSSPPIVPFFCKREYFREGDRRARTRDLRSHNPMLCLLSYGHQARRRFYQRKGAWQSGVSLPSRGTRSSCRRACPRRLCGRVWRAWGLDDHDVALAVVDLDGDAEVVPRFMLVGHFQRGLDGDLLLAVAVAPELQCVVRDLVPLGQAHRRTSDAGRRP